VFHRAYKIQGQNIETDVIVEPAERGGAVR